MVSATLRLCLQVHICFKRYCYSLSQYIMIMTIKTFLVGISITEMYFNVKKSEIKVTKVHLFIKYNRVLELV